MRFNALVIAVGSLLFFAAPLLAQHGHDHSQPAAPRKQAQIVPAPKPPLPAGSDSGHCTAMQAFTPAAVLKHRDHLSLTADQARRLEELAQEVTVSVRPHMDNAMAGHSAAAELISSENADLTAIEATLRDAGEHMLTAHVSMARISVEALRALSQQQKEQFTTMAKAGAGGMSCPIMGQAHGSGGEHKH
jgi:Spy/CpxP family protein refolding chaperone